METVVAILAITQIRARSQAKGGIVFGGGVYLNGGTAARITPEDYGTTLPVLGGDITMGTPQNYKKFKVTPNGTELWEIDSNGKLKRQ